MNFTLADLLFSGLAFALFFLVLVPPGYALGWALDLVSFRKQGAGTRFLLSLPLSIALMPILVYLTGRFAMGWPQFALFGILFGLFLGTAQWRGPHVSRVVWAICACWLAVAFLSLVDLQIGKRAYYSVVAYDLNFRAAVTGALARAHELPAANPFFSNGHPQPFRYHYFWFLLCALPVRLAGLPPRLAVIASAAWCGLALFATIALYVRFFFEIPEEAGRRRVTIIALLLVAVSGLDIIPVLIDSLDGLLGTVDWWNADQVTGWLDTLLWVPHALGSLIACLTGLLILWNRPRFRWQDALPAGMAFASAVGLSIYVTLVFAVFAIAWTVWLAWKREISRALSWVAAGIVAGLLALPFLRELSGSKGAEGSFLVFEIRHFSPVMKVLSGNGFLTLGNLVFLPLNYFLELGFFFVAGCVWFRGRKISKPHEMASAMMLISSVGFCSVIRSHTIQMNDLGARGMLIAQFVLLLWGAIWLVSMGKKSWLVKATLAIGIATSVFELGLLRLYPILTDRGIVAGMLEINPDDDLGARDFSAREVYERLDRTIPASSVVQHHPIDMQDIMAGLYANRQFALMDLSTAVTFAGESGGPEAVLEKLQALFEGRRYDPLKVCRELGIDALVVKDVDPVWADENSWAWRLPVLARAERVIGLDCRAR